MAPKTMNNQLIMVIESGRWFTIKDLCVVKAEMRDHNNEVVLSFQS